MKTNKKILQFNSTSIVELENNKMNQVKGGSTTFFVDWVQDKVDEAYEQMSPYI